MTSPSLSVLGVDFSTASLDARARFAKSGEAAAELLRAALTIDGLREAVLVSTCNRTEYYLVTDGSARVEEAFLALVCPGAISGGGHGASCALVRATGAAAARHLFRVACGLESAILGDAFILGQLKQAMAVASASGSLGPVLSRLLTQAFRLARTAREETDISRGECSHGAVAASLVARGGPARVLIAGAGSVARDVARQMSKRGVADCVIVNRTREHADALAHACGYQAADWTTLGDELRRADVLIAAVACPSPVVGRGAILAARAARPLLVVDLSVPRAVDLPAGPTCLTVDDLAALCEQSVDRRRASIPAVEAMVDREVSSWRVWLRLRPLDGILKSVFEDEQRQRNDLKRAIRVAAGDDAPVEIVVDRIVGRFTRALLRRHAAELRNWADQLQREPSEARIP
jgi:glutamyl-tRNA reductase